MIWYCNDMIRRTTRKTGALVPRAVCSCIALSCAMRMYRPVPSWKQKCTVRCRRKEKSTVPSRREKKKHRAVPSWKNIYTIPSRRANKYIPSRPVVTIFIYRPVPSWNKKVIVLYRSVPSGKFTPTVLSRGLIEATIISIILPSRPVPSSIFSAPNTSKQYRPVPNITSHEKALKVMDMDTWERV